MTTPSTNITMPYSIVLETENRYNPLLVQGLDYRGRNLNRVKLLPGVSTISVRTRYAGPFSVSVSEDGVSKEVENLRGGVCSPSGSLRPTRTCSSPSRGPGRRGTASRSSSYPAPNRGGGGAL